MLEPTWISTWLGKRFFPGLDIIIIIIIIIIARLAGVRG